MKNFLFPFVLGVALALAFNLRAGIKVQSDVQLARVISDQSRVLNMVSNDLRGLASKLDSDSGVSDTDYGASLSIASITTSLDSATH